MSIYTNVSREQLSGYLRQFSVGDLVSFEGIQAGVENTNYFVKTTLGDYVLTLVESVRPEKVGAILDFVALLANQGLKVAKPITSNSGTLVGELNARPAVLTQRLSGAPIHEPTLAQAAVIGETLASFHLAAAEGRSLESASLLQWCSQAFNKAQAALADDETQLISELIRGFENMPWDKFQSGSVHADLFPDNTLFDQETLSGVIDFYHSCNAPFIYDLAVTLNAWCYDESVGCFYPIKEMRLLEAYEQVRRLNDVERFWLPQMRKLAAMRFWLSRVIAKHESRAGDLISVRNPQGKKGLLLNLTRL